MDIIVKVKKARTSRELGLELAAICGTYFLKLEHLHYGYWTLDLPIDLFNLHKAQSQYTDFLLSNIPNGVNTILDVGCGTGQIAKKLLEKGYKVDCVSPSPFLNERARSLLGNGANIFECIYEKLRTDRKYDLILFSESFQYINMEEALKNTTDFLNDGGHLLICDVFKTELGGNSYRGGGHNLNKFHDVLAHYPFESVKDIDITPQTAPNFELYDSTMKNVAAPALEASLDYLSGRYKLMAKFLHWKYKKQIEHIHTKYFNGKVSAEDFRKYKTYRFLLYKKTSPNPSCASSAENHKQASLCPAAS